MTIKNLDTYKRSFVTVPDFARYLIVSERCVYHWIEKGALVVVRVGRTVRIPIESARAFVKIPQIDTTDTSDSRPHSH